MGNEKSKLKTGVKRKSFFRCDLTNLTKTDLVVITYGEADYQVNGFAEIGIKIVTIGVGITKTVTPDQKRLEMHGGENYEIVITSHLEFAESVKLPLKSIAVSSIVDGKRFNCHFADQLLSVRNKDFKLGDLEGVRDSHCEYHFLRVLPDAYEVMLHKTDGEEIFDGGDVNWQSRSYSRCLLNFRPGQQRTRLNGFLILFAKKIKISNSSP